MKRTIQILSTVLVIASMAIYVGCSSSSDPTPTAFELVSLNAGTKDLIGATFATQVPVGENIVAVFTTAVDPATVTASSVTLKAGHRRS